VIDRLRAHVAALLGERHPTTAPAALERSKRYLHDQFTAYGLPVALHRFQAFDTTYHNVIATLPPSNPSATGPPLIIAAHYDTVPASPGADDNASAVAVVLEAARALQSKRLAGEVRLIGFCLEEEDLLGSLAYARELRDRGERIAGAIVLECVGYTSQIPGSQLAPPRLPIPLPPVGDFLGVVGNALSGSLAAAVEEAARRHVPELKTISLLVPGNGEVLPDTRRSDHAAFWHYGYPALMLTDTANFRNPHYHSPTDTIETLDFIFMQRVAEAVIAAAVTLAGVTEEAS
jgi:Zn-dependent M28 family amino/carboxypeptidase